MKYQIDDVIQILESYDVKFDLDVIENCEFEYFAPLDHLKDNSITWARYKKNINFCTYIIFRF